MEERNELIEQRYTNLKKLKELGVNPFAEEFSDIRNIGAVKEAYSEGLKVNIAGRIMARREHGKSAFLDIKDFTGKMQAYFRKDVIGDDAFEIFKSLDIGDIVGVSGELFKTRTGEDT
ncbi:MAG: OB-fold nucleic acid binding domain-containing protein, partial [Candidatus Omnitrophota bacterium]